MAILYVKISIDWSPFHSRITIEQITQQEAGIREILQTASKSVQIRNRKKEVKEKKRKRTENNTHLVPLFSE